MELHFLHHVAVALHIREIGFLIELHTTQLHI